MSLVELKFPLELSVKSSTDNLSVIRDFIKSTALSLGYSNAVIGNIILAVDEACTNIIKHAYKYSHTGDIQIELNRTTDKFVITILDSGIEFDSKLIPEPDIKEYYKQRRIGGLGMYLMKKMMDEVVYSKNKNKNQVKMVKYLP
ncbi:MAG: ATP-binding protein [Melioribacteraceae bacterium]|nr:ATP-binding protein [Melioribacteraceae bacterium]